MNGVFLLLALAGRGDSVHVRGVDRDTTLAVVATSSGSALRADVVLPLLGGMARITGFGRWTIEVRGSGIGLVDGVPFAMSKGIAIPLAAAPRQQDDAFLLPLQILSELVPRLGNGITWDAGRRELRVDRPAVVRATLAPRATGTGAVRAATPRHWTVVVDAGHGGPDAGMHGPIGGSFTINEKDITLGVSKRLSRELEARGVDVVMTRTTDTLIALSDRGRIANERQGSLFISIHVNAANPNWKNPGAARGFETYFLAEAKTEDDRRVARMENEAVRFETTSGGPRDDALGFILSDMKQNEHLRESNDLAESVQARLGRIHPGPSRGVKQAGFRVLVTSFMPSVLVEIGFGTNRAEAAWIAGAEGQRAIASAVADAAMDYLANYERRIAGATGVTGVSPGPRR
jgi:N-acetylmuramoyl-L-alanine amidase